MRNECWEAIHAVFEKLDVLANQPEPSQSAPEGEQAAPVLTPPPMLTLVSVRSEVRTQLDRLRMVLHDHYTERDAYLVLFPIVTHLDEYVQTKLLSSNHPKAAYFSKLMKWPTLQKELFDIEDGGVLFYDTLDDLLRKPQTPTFVFEVYLLCLNHGFLGKYNDNAVKIAEYKKKLAEKIPVDTPPEAALRGPSKPLAKTISHYWYYAGALVAIFVFYSLLHTVAQAYVKSPPPILAEEPTDEEAVQKKEVKTTTAGNRYSVQFGPDYDDEAVAQRVLVQLKSQAYVAKLVKKTNERGEDRFWIRMGDVTDEENAKRICNNLNMVGRLPAQLAKDNRCRVVEE